MRLNSNPIVLIAAVCVVAFSAGSARAQLPDGVKSDLGPNVPAFKVRPGYRVTRAVAPDALRWARFLQFSADGKTLFVTGSERQRDGSVYALRDPDGDGMFKTVTTFVPNKPTVQGMAIHDGWLYYSQASEGSVSRARDTNNDGVADEVQTVIPARSIPAGGGHPYIGMLVTDNEIYVTASDPTNMTPALDSERKTLYVFDKEGKNRKVFATGIRNTEKIRFRPGTTEIWGFDHGSDNFGQTYGERTGQMQPITDVNPPEEFNHYVEGGFYGHPYIMGNGVPRPDLVGREGVNIVELASKTTAPGWLVHAHWAVLGFTFAEKDLFGAKGDCFFASHGSWNSIKPVGAVVQRVMFDSVTGKPYGSQTIVDCQVGTRRFGRPVDVAEAPDGSLIFSCDDPAPALYRITKSNQ